MAQPAACGSRAFWGAEASVTAPSLQQRLPVQAGVTMPSDHKESASTDTSFYTCGLWLEVPPSQTDRGLVPSPLDRENRLTPHPHPWCSHHGKHWQQSQFVSGPDQRQRRTPPWWPLPWQCRWMTVKWRTCNSRLGRWPHLPLAAGIAKDKQSQSKGSYFPLSHPISAFLVSMPLGCVFFCQPWAPRVWFSPTHWAFIYFVFQVPGSQACSPSLSIYFVLVLGSHWLRLGTYLWKDGDAEGLVGDLTH